MNKNENLLTQLHSTLSNKGFEIFIKDLLEKLGFDDVQITGRSGDSGIDLKAILRRSEIPGIELNLPYIIQAKKNIPRYNTKSKIYPRT